MKYNLKNAPNWAPAIWAHLENMKAELRERFEKGKYALTKAKGSVHVGWNWQNKLIKEILGE